MTLSAKVLWFSLMALGAALFVSCLAVWWAPNVGLFVHDEQSRLNSNAIWVGLLNDEAQALVTSERSSEVTGNLCAERRDGRCFLIGVPMGQPPCALLAGGIEDCIAIQLRRQLYDLPEVRDLIERRTAVFCTYIEDPRTSSDYLIDVLGCRRPSGSFRLFRRVEPTLCIVVLSDDDPARMIERYAVRRGRRVNHSWCNSVTLHS